MTDIINQYFRKLLKEFNNSPYLGYKKKNVHNEPTEAYLFLIKQVYNLIKINNYVRLRIKIVKLDVNKKIGHVNKIIQYGITSVNGKEFENINVTRTCDKEENKHKEYSLTYGNEGE